MKFTDINPYVRQVLTTNMINTENNDCVFRNIITVDSRLFYILSGEGTMVVNGISYSLKPNCLILFLAGTVYSWHTDNIKSITVNFEYTQKSCHIHDTFHPHRSDNFNSSLILDNTYFIDEDKFNSPVYIENASFLLQRIRALSEEYFYNSKYRQEILSTSLKSILFSVANFIYTRDKASINNELSREIIHFIQTNYAENINNHTIAEKFHYSQTYINRVLKRHTGKTLHEFILYYRINMATEVLRCSDIPIQDVASSVGFSDIPHFIKTFRKAVGVSPSRYRKMVYMERGF